MSFSRCFCKRTSWHSSRSSWIILSGDPIKILSKSLGDFFWETFQQFLSGFFCKTAVELLPRVSVYKRVLRVYHGASLQISSEIPIVISPTVLLKVVGWRKAFIEKSKRMSRKIFGGRDYRCEDITRASYGGFKVTQGRFWEFEEDSEGFKEFSRVFKGRFRKFQRVSGVPQGVSRAF